MRRARGARCGSRPWVRRGWPQARRRTLKVHATAAPLPHTHTNRLGPHQGGAPLSSRTMGGGERGNSPARLLASTAPLLGLLHPHPSWAPSSNAAPAPSCRLLPSHSQRPPARAPRALACQLEHTEVRRRTAAAGWFRGARLGAGYVWCGKMTDASGRATVTAATSLLTLAASAGAGAGATYKTVGASPDMALSICGEEHQRA